MIGGAVTNGGVWFACFLVAVFVAICSWEARYERKQKGRERPYDHERDGV